MKPHFSLKTHISHFILGILQEEPIHWKRQLCLEQLKVTEEDDSQQQDGWRQSEIS